MESTKIDIVILNIIKLYVMFLNGMIITSLININHSQTSFQYTRFHCNPHRIVVPLVTLAIEVHSLNSNSDLASAKQMIYRHESRLLCQNQIYKINQKHDVILQKYTIHCK